MVNLGYFIFLKSLAIRMCPNSLTNVKWEETKFCLMGIHSMLPSNACNVHLSSIAMLILVLALSSK